MAVAVVTCGMEMQKPSQIKAHLELDSVDAYKEVQLYEKEIYKKMVKQVRSFS